MPTGQSPNIDEELKKIQLAIAQIDLKLKQVDLENRPSFWKSVFTNPAFLAAVITVCITGGTTFITSNAAQHQREAELQRAVVQREIDDARSRAEMNVRILLGVINFPETEMVASRLKLFLDSGLLKDDRDGTLRKAQERMEREAKAPKP